MDRRRAGFAVVLLLATGLTAAAVQGPPVYVYTGAAPSGACSGSRVWIDALGSGTYYCNAGTWALVGGGGGTPGGLNTQIQYNNAGSFAGAGQLTWVASTNTLVSGAPNGSDAIAFSTNGARLHLGTGSLDWLYSDGFQIRTTGSLAASGAMRAGGFSSSAATGTAAVSLNAYQYVYFYDGAAHTTGAYIGSEGAIGEDLAIYANGIYGGYIRFNGPVTASGNVVASGNVIAPNFLGIASTAKALSTTGGAGQFWAYNNSWAIPTQWVSPPAAANSTGDVGNYSADASYFYVCHATNTWKRVAIATW